MGTFHYAVFAGTKDGSRLESVEAQVDSGSTYAMMPSTTLQGIEISPQWASTFEFADGRQEEYELGEVLLQINGESRTTICIFGGPDSRPIRGDYSLEGFGLTVDPVNRKLIPARLFLA